MDSWFGGAPLQKFKDEIEELRTECRWEQVLARIAEFEQTNHDQTDISIKFYKGDSRIELDCDRIATENCQRTLQENGDEWSYEDGVDSVSSSGDPDVGEEEISQIKHDGLDILSELVERNHADEDKIWIQLAYALSGKYHFMKHRYETALEVLHKMDFDWFGFLRERNLRTVMIMAEALAVKGFCLDLLPLTSDEVQRRDHARKYLEVAAILTLHASELIPADAVLTKTALEMQALWMPPVLEQAVVECVNYDSKHRDSPVCLKRARWFLQFIRSPSLRVFCVDLCRQIAESNVNRRSSFQEEALKNLTVPVNSRVDNVNRITSELFTPKTAVDESLLLLLIGANVAADEIVLNRDPEFSIPRKLSVAMAQPVLDLSVLLLMRLDIPEFLPSYWGRIATKCGDIPDVAVDYATILFQIGNFTESYGLVRQSLREDPESRRAHLLGAMICLDQFDDPEKACNHAEKALKASKLDDELYFPTFLLATSLSVLSCKMGFASPERNELGQKSLGAFKNAIAMRNDDFRLFFNLSLHFALHGDLNNAVVNLQRSLFLNCDFVPAWHLTALLYSAIGRPVDALRVLEEEVEGELQAGFNEHVTVLALLELLRKFENAVAYAEKILNELPALPVVEKPCDRLEESDVPGSSWEDLNNQAPNDTPAYDADQLGTTAHGDDNTENKGIVKPEKLVPYQNGNSVESKTECESGFDERNAQDGVTCNGDVASGSRILEQFFEVTETSNEEKGVSAIASSVVIKIAAVLAFGAGVGDDDDCQDEDCQEDDFPEIDCSDGWSEERYQRVWLMSRIAELKLKMADLEGPDKLVSDARKLNCRCHLLDHVRGLLALRSGDQITAKAAFELAVAWEPSFLPSWFGLMDIAEQSGNLGLVDVYLRRVRKLWPESAITWQLSERFRLELEEDDTSFSERASLLIESGQPVRPFCVINRIISF